MCKPHMNAAYQAKFRAGKAVMKWSELKAIQEVYRMCSELTETTGIAHHVDHHVPLNSSTVSGLHVLSNLRILTASENIAKSNSFGEA